MRDIRIYLAIVDRERRTTKETWCPERGGWMGDVQYIVGRSRMADDERSMLPPPPPKRGGPFYLRASCIIVLVLVSSTYSLILSIMSSRRDNPFCVVDEPLAPPSFSVEFESFILSPPSFSSHGNFFWWLYVFSRISRLFSRERNSFQCYRSSQWSVLFRYILDPCIGEMGRPKKNEENESATEKEKKKNIKSSNDRKDRGMLAQRN